MTAAISVVSRRRPTRAVLRLVGGVALISALGVAVWLQRATMVDAMVEVRNMSPVAMAALLILAVFERWVRADIVRSLMNTSGDAGSAPPMSFETAVTLHEVGTAASKALPMGGAVGTGVRWSIARDADVSASRFTSVFVAYGAATTVVAWMLPLLFLVVDVSSASGDRNDWLLIAGITTVLLATLIGGRFVLRSERIERWLGARIGTLVACGRRRLTGVADERDAATTADVVGSIRSRLQAIGRRPGGLLVRTVAAQCSGAIILLVSLRSLGVGGELGVVEFARVYFVAQLLGSFVPTPGGVGVVEAGLTGALVAAGAELRLALAAVLVYRLITYALPIVVGSLLYLRWRLASSTMIEDRCGDATVAEIVELVPVAPVAVAS